MLCIVLPHLCPREGQAGRRSGGKVGGGGRRRREGGRRRREEGRRRREGGREDGGRGKRGAFGCVMGSTQTTVQNIYVRYSTPLPPSCVTSLPSTLSPCRLGSLPSDSRHPLTAQHPQPQSTQADLTHYTTTLPDHFISRWAREEASAAHLDLNCLKAAPKDLPRHGRPLQHHYTIHSVRALQSQKKHHGNRVHGNRNHIK